MPEVVFPEFRDQVKETTYPFVDTATLTDEDGKLTLPRNLFIDASIYIPNTVGVVYLSSLEVAANKVLLTISIIGSQKTVTGTIADVINYAGTDYSISLYETGYKVGMLLINGNKLGYFKGLDKGVYRFRYTATAFVPSCIVPIKTTGVTSLAVNSRSAENTLYGDVWVIGHDGVTLRTQPGIQNSMRIDVVGDPLFKQVINEDVEYRIDKPVRTINDIPPDEFGNFNITRLTGEDSLRLETSPYGIYIYLAGAHNGN